jgi:uncharacterized protein
MREPPFRIVQLSDLHGNESIIDLIADEITGADLMVLSGDITHFGGKRQAAQLVEHILRLNEHTVAVPGNCDRSGVAEYLEHVGVSVDGSIREINGFRVGGLGGSLPAPAPTPTVYEENEFADRFDKLLEEYGSPDIAVIHQPPADSKLDRILSGVHVGSQTVRRFIERSGAIACLTGHIHESWGTEMIGETLLVNPGAAVQGRYGIIEIVERLATADLKNCT